MVSLIDSFNLITLHAPEEHPEVMKIYKDVEEIVEKDNRGFTIARPLFSQSDLPFFLKVPNVQLKDFEWDQPALFSVLLHHNNPLAAKHLDLLPEVILTKVREKKCKLLLDNVLEGHPIDQFMVNLYKSIESLNLPADQIYYVTNNLLAEDIHQEFLTENSIQQGINVISFMYNVHDIKRLIDTPLFKDIIFETETEELIPPYKSYALPSAINIEEEIKYKKSNLDNSKHFLKVNRTNREERNLLMLFLNKEGLLSKTLTSFPDFPQSYHYPEGLFDEYLTEENIKSLNEKLPFDIDETDRSNHGPAGFSLNQFDADLPFNPKHYRDTFISIVMCAFPFDHGACHLHSSTFNPIYCGHPVIQFGPYGHLRKLRELGFKTFGKWWDESYDEIPDGWNRFLAVLEVIKGISNLTTDQMLQMYTEMKDILQHNHDLIKNYDGSQILIDRILTDEI